MILSIFLITLSYLIGSISSAIIVSKLFSLPDPRQEGSKNPGATNILRLAGKKYAGVVLLADILKGLLPVLIAKACYAHPATVAFTALAAVVGHIFPIFFGFKGGKGVATAIGALLGFHFIVGVLVIATWLAVAKFNRHSSLASIISISLAPFYSLMTIGHIETFPPLFAITILVLFMHRNNITRLSEGTEPTINLKSNVIETFLEPSEQVKHHKATDSAPEKEKKVVKPAPTPAKPSEVKKTPTAKKPATAPQAKAEVKKAPAKKTSPKPKSS